MKRTLAVAATAGLSLGLLLGSGASAEAAAKPYRFANCAAMHKKFPHGVGKPGAKDKTSGKPVTNFYRSLAWYTKNKGLDRDHDGIACEKH